MMRRERIGRVLFLQEPQLLANQRQKVLSRLAQGLPEAKVIFAESANHVPSEGMFDALIAPTLSWLPEAINRLASVRWIHFLSAGVDKIWEMDFDKRAVLLTKSSGVHGPPMSEFAI